MTVEFIILRAAVLPRGFRDKNLGLRITFNSIIIYGLLSEINWMDGWMMMMMMMMMDELQSCHKVQGTARTRNSEMCHAVMSEQWKRL